MQKVVIINGCNSQERYKDRIIGSIIWKIYWSTGENKSPSRPVNAALSDVDRKTVTEPSHQLRWRCPWATWSPCCLTLGKRSASRLSAGSDSRSAAAAGIAFLLSRRRLMRRFWRACREDSGPKASRKSLEAKVFKLVGALRPRDTARDAWAQSSRFLRFIRSRLASSLITGM